MPDNGRRIRVVVDFSVLLSWKWQLKANCFYDLCEAALIECRVNRIDLFNASIGVHGLKSFKRTAKSITRMIAGIEGELWYLEATQLLKEILTQPLRQKEHVLNVFPNAHQVEL